MPLLIYQGTIRFMPFYDGEFVVAHFGWTLAMAASGFSQVVDIGLLFLQEGDQQQIDLALKF